MFARVTRYLDRVTGRGAHSGNFVGGHRAADAGAVYNYSHFSSAIRHSARHRVGNVGIVNCVFRVGAEVVHSMTNLREPLLQLLFHFEPAVVRAHCYRSRDVRATAWNTARYLNLPLHDD